MATDGRDQSTPDANRAKPDASAGSPFPMLSVYVLGLLAAICWVYLLAGLFSGSVQFPSKHASLQITRGESPKVYWACVTVWLAGGVLLTRAAAASLQKAMSQAHPATRRRGTRRGGGS